MRFSNLLCTSVAAVLVHSNFVTSTAIPLFCLTDHDANVVANNFAQLLSNFSVPLAQAILADSFTDQSDSANSLIDGGTQSPFPVRVLQRSLLMSLSCLTTPPARKSHVQFQSSEHRPARHAAKHPVHDPKRLAHLRPCIPSVGFEAIATASTGHRHI